MVTPEETLNTVNSHAEVEMATKDAMDNTRNCRTSFCCLPMRRMLAASAEVDLKVLSWWFHSASRVSPFVSVTPSSKASFGRVSMFDEERNVLAGRAWFNSKLEVQFHGMKAMLRRREKIRTQETTQTPGSSIICRNPLLPSPVISSP